MRKLAKVRDVKVGSLPAAVVVSSLSKSVYVANEGDGTIVALDGSRFEILARMKAQPGLRAIRIRWTVWFRGQSSHQHRLHFRLIFQSSGHMQFPSAPAPIKSRSPSSLPTYAPRVMSLSP